VLADSLRTLNDIELALAIGRKASGKNGTAIDEHIGRFMRRCRSSAGMFFIATADGDVSIHAAATDDCFDGFHR